MLTMTEDEIRTLMHSHRWTYQERKRRSLGTKYGYAKRKVRGKVVEVSICPHSQLDQLTQEQLLAKLAMSRAESL